MLLKTNTINPLKGFQVNLDEIKMLRFIVDTKADEVSNLLLKNVLGKATKVI